MQPLIFQSVLSYYMQKVNDIGIKIYKHAHQNAKHTLISHSQ